MEQKQNVCSIIRRAEENYLHGMTKIGEYVDFSMHDTIERITAYINSKHISGPKDSLERDKPFFNIITAACNVTYRATDIDRKDIRFIPDNSGSVVLAFVANVLLQKWMRDARFGQFLNQWGRILSQYGSAIVKFLEARGQLNWAIIPWNRAIVDPISFNALPRIEKQYRTPQQLIEMATPGHPNYAHYDLEAVKSMINAREPRRNLDGEQVDNQAEFVEYYEVHGLLPDALLEKDVDSAPEELWQKWSQQMHVVSYVQTEKGYNDFTLYKGTEVKDPYMITHLIEEDGRTLSIGTVESLFDAQWMQNHSMKNMKDTLDLASKIIFQTADAHFVGRNVLSAIESGDILIHEENRPLTELNNSKSDITAFDSFRKQWELLGQNITNTPDAVRGNTMPSGTPYSLGAYLGQQSNNLFEQMTENKGLHIEDIMRTYVIPFIRKKLSNKDEVVAILDAAGIQEIDAMYVPKAAIKAYNDRVKQALINGTVEELEEFDAMKEEGAIRQTLGTLGDKRFFKPDELGEKQWDEIFSDFNWENIRVEVTNEQTDKQAVLQTLDSVFKTLASLNGQPLSPELKMLLGKILQETAVISPIQISTSTSTPTPAVGGQGEVLPTKQPIANGAR